MLQSMTGYGRGVVGNFRIEIRSSNHKNLDIQINMPPYLFSHELEVKKKTRQMFSRGRIDIYIPRYESENIKLKVNKTLAREYYNALDSLREELSIHDDIRIDILAMQRDIFLVDEPEIDESEFYGALSMALRELQKSRVEEGIALISDISERINSLKKHISAIQGRRAEFVNNAKNKLSERLRELLENSPIDDVRLVQETAILVEKSDITEEIVRINSHIEKFEEILKSEDTVGKKLDFVVQELRREINTISSKAQDIEIINNVVEMKHELEKIKEQLHNLQ